MTSLEDEHVTSEADFVYIALSLLASREEKSIIPEVMFLISPQQVIDLIRAFGGRTVKIPTVSDFSKDLTSAIAAYHRKVNEWSWNKIGKMMDLDGRTLNSIQRRVEHWEEWMKQEQMSFPELLRGEGE